MKTNGLILACYRGDLILLAQAHARTVTGAHVQTLDVLNHMPLAVSEDAASDDWDEADTPVQDPPEKK